MGEGDSESERPKRGAARVATFGYGRDAREQALRLRAAGWDVDVVIRAGGMSWVNAVADGFRPVPFSVAVPRADVVVVHLPGAEQPSAWAYALAPLLAPRTLVVFVHGSALYSGAVDPGPGLDVVLVAGGARGPRVAVHRDASGHAHERALAFARAAHGQEHVGTTTLDGEVGADLFELGAKMGGLAGLLAEWDRLLATPSHEPDEAALTYYERLRATVLADGRKRGAA
jgi:ketol-acid reductoisomerase